MPHHPGEIIPQAICSRHGVTIGAFCAPVVRALMWLCSPISWPLGWMLHLMLGKDDPMLPRQHLKTILHLHGKDAGGALAALWIVCHWVGLLELCKSCWGG